MRVHLWAVVLSGARIVSQIGRLTALTSLNVGGMYAVGTIPTQVGRLSLLQELYINYNSLTGTLPTQVSALVRLKTFLFSDNRFTGTLPPLPPSITYVKAYNNRFTGAVVLQNPNPQVVTFCIAQELSTSEANCFDVVPSVCDKAVPQITFSNGSSTPAYFRGCLNATDRSVFSLPKSYLFSPAPPTGTGLFALDVAPSVNVTLLLNETVLSVGAATAFFFATTPVAIGVRQTSAAARPTVTVRACSCDGNSAVFSSALVNGSDSLVALTVNASLALQPSLQQGRRVRGVFCASLVKHHYAVGVRAGTVVVKFDRFAIFGTAAATPAVPQLALSLYLVSASGGAVAISRVLELNTSAPTLPPDVPLSAALAPAGEAVLVLAASVQLMYSISFTLADCSMGNDSTQTLAAGVRTVSNLCPAGDRDAFVAPVQAGNFTLTIDVGDQDLSALFALQATLRIFESAQRRNVTAQPACVLVEFVANNVSSCSWEFDQSDDGFLTIELATVAANSDQNQHQKNMTFLLLFVGGVGAALYRQSFDVGVVANGTRNATLGDGASISGSAVVENGELGLTKAALGQRGAMAVPPLNGSSLGWKMSFSLRYGPLAMPANVTDTSNAMRLHWTRRTSSGSSIIGSWVIKTTSVVRGLLRAEVSILRYNTNVNISYHSVFADRDETANITVLATWCPEHGASLQTAGFLTAAELIDVKLVVGDADSLVWSIGSTANQAFLQDVIIDDVVVETPCDDCRAQGRECVWGSGGQFECRLASVTSAALQFLRVRQLTGHGFTAPAVGMDFTVNAAIDVYAIGLLDADAHGVNGTLTARIFDRSTDQVVAGPVTISSGEMRTDDANPFVFKNVPTVRLQPGVYNIVSIGFASDRYISTASSANSVEPGETGDGAIHITASNNGGNGLSSSATRPGSGRGFHVGATFLFGVVPEMAAREQKLFADCEAVACAGLATGEYNVSGALRFCNNDMAGGGWLRLWRANETRCEANGWTAARNPRATGVDPAGCRLIGPSCVAMQETQAPFAFGEVRGGNWRVWVFGTPDGFSAAAPGDGIVVRDGNGNVVWMLAVGLNVTTAALLCPCEGEFQNSTATAANLAAIGPHWSCDRDLARRGSWAPLFDGQSMLTCAAASGSPLWFQRVLSVPQRALSVAICKDSDIDEDFKLAAGDLFVRATIGFDMARCPTTTTAVPPTVATTASTTEVPPIATSASTDATEASTTSSSSSSVLTTAAATATDSIDVPLIAGAAGGAVVLLAVVGVAVAVGMRRRGKSAPSNETPMSVTDKPSEYGAAPPAKDAPPLRSNEYAPISAAEAHGEYASMRADSVASLPSSNYERWSDNGAAPKSHYADTGAEFTAGLPSGSNYGRM